MEQRRASDEFMLQVSRELGGIQQAMESFAVDRKEFQTELKTHALETRESIAEISKSISSMTHVLGKIPEIHEKVVAVEKRVSSLEEVEKKRKWTIAGIITGASIFGGASMQYLGKILGSITHNGS